MYISATLRVQTLQFILKIQAAKMLNLNFQFAIEDIKILNKIWQKIKFFFKVIGEQLLWIGSCAGPLMVLTLIMLCDFYLVWKPFLFTLLPGSNYKKAFRVAKREVATFFQHHMKMFYGHEYKGIHFCNNWVH